MSNVARPFVAQTPDVLMKFHGNEDHPRPIARMVFGQTWRPAGNGRLDDPDVNRRVLAVLLFLDGAGA